MLAKEAIVSQDIMLRNALHEAYTNLVNRGRLKTNVNQAALISRLASLQEELRGHATPGSSSPNGIYIYGSVGTGKSRLADLFAATLPIEVSKRRTHFHEFMIDIHSRLHLARNAATYQGDPLTQIGRDVSNESRVLCLDEFQVTDIVDAMIMRRLFTSYWASGGILVSTSNRHPSRLYENGLNRDLFIPFIKELEHRCEVWQLSGKEDYRRSSGHARDEIFVTDVEVFQNKLATAIDGRKPEMLTLNIRMNRTLQVQSYTSPATGPVISTTFDDLFKQNLKPLGAADYHAICDAASTIFISGVRQFRASEFDFARRFITFVDVAYESKTKVVILSETSLADLFSNLTPELDLKKVLPTTLNVRKEGGASSSNSTTFIGEVEWSATGLKDASLATGGAGETDVRFAVARAASRLYEMGRTDYGTAD